MLVSIKLHQLELPATLPQLECTRLPNEPNSLSLTTNIATLPHDDSRIAKITIAHTRTCIGDGFS